MIINFIQETLNRFFAKSPKYFRIWQWIAIIVAFATGIPAILVEFQTTLGIHLPEFIVDISSKVASIAALAAGFLSKLVVKDVNPEKMQVTSN